MPGSGTSVLADLMTHTPARDLLHGCVRLTAEQGGWVRPWRLTEAQVRAVGSCQAWHPGLLRQMAKTTAGISLEFDTDATRVEVEVRRDEIPAGTRAVLDRMGSARDHELVDCLSADVDDRHLGGLVLSQDRIALYVDDFTEAGGQATLPGLGTNHRVRLWLPALSGCVLRGVTGNGTYLTPVPERDCLLVIGDSIAQGFVAGDPALSWPSVLAGLLSHDVVNVSLGGQVFQPGSLAGLSTVVSPAAIVVALGENYRYEPCAARVVARDISSMLAEVERLWPGVATYVCSPLWHDEAASPSQGRSCWREVPDLIRRACAGHAAMTFVDGLSLMDHVGSLHADVDGHPNADGARQVAERLRLLLRSNQEGDEDRRLRVPELLRRAPRRAFPLLEAARRRIGRFILAEPGCVLFDAGDDQQLLFASDHALGRAALAILCDAAALGLLETGLLSDARRLGGYGDAMPHHLVVYHDKTPPVVEGSFDVRVLDGSFVDAVCEHYSHPEFITVEEVAERLARDQILGGFEDGQLVGFVGEHAEGSIGMLEVFEGHRGQGWGSALLAAKISQHLERGWTPWCEVFPDNDASIALHRKLGMTITPAREQCYLFRTS